MVLLGFGQDHYANGQTFYDGVFALADITGQECKHGAGSTCVDLTGAVAQGVQSTAGMNLDGAVAGPTVYVNHLPQLVEEGSIGEFDTAPRSMYIYYCNPLANMPDRQRWLSMLDKMDLVVVFGHGHVRNGGLRRYCFACSLPLREERSYFFVRLASLSS